MSNNLYRKRCEMIEEELRGLLDDWDLMVDYMMAVDRSEVDGLITARNHLSEILLELFPKATDGAEDAEAESCR